jgi:hypothetical protein
MLMTLIIACARAGEDQGEKSQRVSAEAVASLIVCNASLGSSRQDSHARRLRSNEGCDPVYLPFVCSGAARACCPWGQNFSVFGTISEIGDLEKEAVVSLYRRL